MPLFRCPNCNGKLRVIQVYFTLGDIKTTKTYKGYTCDKCGTAVTTRRRFAKVMRELKKYKDE